jgi:hypothetical protein
MNHTTLGIVAVLVAAALVVGSFAATIPAFAKSKGSGTKVKVGDTKNKCIERADNSQHVAFGAGSVGDAAVNIPINVQAQGCNAGSTGSGGNSNNADRSSDDNSGVWNSGLSTSDH